MIQNGTILTQAIDGIGASVQTAVVQCGGAFIRQFRFYDTAGVLFYTLQCSAAQASALNPMSPSIYQYPSPPPSQ